MGTPSYMAPEQARGEKGAVGPAADVYALGAILYECLTGRPPYRAETATATLQQVVADDPVPPARLNPRVPRDLQTICLKCLDKEPHRRYTSAQALVEDLRRFERGEPIAARPVGSLGAAGPVRDAAGRPAAGMLAAVVLLVATGVVGTGLLYRQWADARARQAQTDQEVRGALERARGLLSEGWLAHDLAKLTEARAEGNRAADIARSGGASAAVRQEAEAFQEDATRRLERAERNRALLLALQDVPVQNETLAYVYGRANSPVGLALPSADELYAAAFRRWGLDVDGTPEAEVVARLGAEPEPVVQELIAGLDGWMLERRRNRPVAEWRRLYRVAERLDGSALRQRMQALPGRRGAARCIGRGRNGRDGIALAGRFVGAGARRHLAGVAGTAAGDRPTGRDRTDGGVTGRRVRRGGRHRGGGAGVARGGDGARPETSRPARRGPR